MCVCVCTCELFPDTAIFFLDPTRFATDNVATHVPALFSRDSDVNALTWLNYRRDKAITLTALTSFKIHGVIVPLVFRTGRARVAATPITYSRFSRFGTSCAFEKLIVYRIPAI